MAEAGGAAAAKEAYNKASTEAYRATLFPMREIFPKSDRITTISKDGWRTECNCIQEENLFPYAGKEGTVISVSKSTFDETELYFIETDNYIFILDKVNDITDGGEEVDYGWGLITLDKFILTSNKYPGCITLIVDKRTKILSVKFVTMRVDCTFRAGEIEMKSLGKIFSKIHAALEQTGFKGKMELEDDAKFSNGVRICNLKAIKILFNHEDKLDSTFKLGEIDLSTVSTYTQYGFIPVDIDRCCSMLLDKLEGLHYHLCSMHPELLDSGITEPPNLMRLALELDDWINEHLKIYLLFEKMENKKYVDASSSSKKGGYRKYDEALLLHKLEKYKSKYYQLLKQ